MLATTNDRKQRLRTLENQIRKGYESFVSTGSALIEIRDEQLWKEAGFNNWDDYLKRRIGEEFGIEQTQARQVMHCSIIRQKLPDVPAGHRHADGPTPWSQRAVYEFTRLAPEKITTKGKSRDVDSLRKQDLGRVAKTAFQIAAERKKPLTSTIVRAAVDKELGIDRAAKATDTKQTNNSGIDLPDYLRQALGRIEGITSNLAKVPGESWTLLERSHPGLVTQVAKACDELAGLLRS